MKEKIFINFSNHPADKWSKKQISAAQKYGKVTDIRFPVVDEAGDEDYIRNLADEYLAKIMKYEPAAVMCQGEFCLSYAIITALKEKGITVLAACSKRIVKETEDEKKSFFVFERFREY